MIRHNLCSVSEETSSSPFLSPINSPVLPGPSRIRPSSRTLPDPTWVARCSWLLIRLFPDFSEIFLHTLLETRDFDLLSTLEILVDLLQKGSFVHPRVAPPLSFYPGIRITFLINSAL